MLARSLIGQRCRGKDIPLKHRVHYTDPLATQSLSEVLNNFLLHYNPGLIRPLVLICIGTDRSTGDSLGPLTGSFLSKSAASLVIYGTLEDPVHAANLEAKLAEISAKFNDPLILAIDACLGQSENVGTITIAPGPLRPGAGVNKNLPEVGDIQITGIVNVGGYMEYLVLQNTRLSVVMRMAEEISRSLAAACEKAKLNHMPDNPGTVIQSYPRN